MLLPSLQKSHAHPEISVPLIWIWFILYTRIKRSLFLNIEAIYHHQHGAYAYTNGLDTMRVRLRTSAHDNVECLVRWNDRCSSEDCQERVTPMTWLASDGTFTYWEAELHEPNR